MDVKMKLLSSFIQLQLASVGAHGFLSSGESLEHGFS